MNHHLTTLFVCVVAAVLQAAESSGPVSLTRYALVIGSNIGNRDRVGLKYAVSDAQSFADVLTDMGGVQKHRCIIVRNPDRVMLLEGLEKLRSMVDDEKNLGGRKEAVVYYSGHADENGIILGGEGLPMRKSADICRRSGWMSASPFSMRANRGV